MGFAQSGWCTELSDATSGFPWASSSESLPNGPGQSRGCGQEEEESSVEGEREAEWQQNLSVLTPTKLQLSGRRAAKVPLYVGSSISKWSPSFNSMSIALQMPS